MKIGGNVEKESGRLGSTKQLLIFILYDSEYITHEIRTFVFALRK